MSLFTTEDCSTDSVVISRLRTDIVLCDCARGLSMFRPLTAAGFIAMARCDLGPISASGTYVLSEEAAMFALEFIDSMIPSVRVLPI